MLEHDGESHIASERSRRAVLDEQVPLVEGANHLVATAADSLGHTTSSAPYTVTRDTHRIDYDQVEKLPGCEGVC